MKVNCKKVNFPNNAFAAVNILKTFLYISKQIDRFVKTCIKAEAIGMHVDIVKFFETLFGELERNSERAFYSNIFFIDNRLGSFRGPSIEVVVFAKKFPDCKMTFNIAL